MIRLRQFCIVSGRRIDEIVTRDDQLDELIEGMQLHCQ